MFKKHHIISAGILLLLLNFHCSQQKPLDSPVDEYHSITRDFVRQSEKTNSKPAYARLLDERNSRLRKLMKRLPAHPAEDRLELIRGKIFFDLKKTKNATEIFEYLVGKKSPLSPLATFEEVRIYLENRQYEPALDMFRSIENAIPRDENFYDVILQFAFNLKDPNARWIFSRQYLSAARAKKYLQPAIGVMVTNLAEIERIRFGRDRAVQSLETALKQSMNPEARRTILCYLKPLRMVEWPAPPIRTENWINQDSKPTEMLIGKPTLLDFWSPSCPPCREMLPVLNRLYNRFRDRGLQVIGIVQVTRRYSDDLHHKFQVNPETFINLTRKLLKRHRVDFPVALTTGNSIQESFGVLGYPTLFLLDPEGKIRDFKLGAEDLEIFIEKIERYLPVKASGY